MLCLGAKNWRQKIGGKKLMIDWQSLNVRSALIVAIVVGTVLNLINQPEALLGEAPIVWWKVLLTYCVPFAVSCYGSWAALKRLRSGE